MKIKQGSEWTTKWGYPYLSADSTDQLSSDVQSIQAVSLYGSSRLKSSSGPYLSGLMLQSNLGNWTCLGKCGSSEILMGTVSPDGALYYISAGFTKFFHGYNYFTRPSVLTFAFTCSI